MRFRVQALACSLDSRNQTSKLALPRSEYRDRSANGARYESQGQARSASPLVSRTKPIRALKERDNSVYMSALQASLSCGRDYHGQARSASPLVSRTKPIRALKERNNSVYMSALQASLSCGRDYQGRRAARLPLAFISRAFGALAYRAFGALAYRAFGISCLWRSGLTFGQAD